MAVVAHAKTFNMDSASNLAVYWGQNSYGASNPSNTGGFQKPLSFYCRDDTIDAFPIAFLHNFRSTGGLPEIDLSNICSSSTNGVFPGTNLANCQFLAEDIKSCQDAGKIVTLSLGGATASAGFSDDEEAKKFAQMIWNVFLGGKSSTRPFGSAILDGVDLDIEGGGTTGYVAFVKEIRALSSGSSKKFYITGAPQCPFPDAFLGSVINAVGFDALYVQFYNNWCGLHNFDNPNAWNFGTWDEWAKKTSPNPNVKIYIGAPASSSAAGSGYVDAARLGTIAQEVRSKYSSFGGVMLWDVSQAYANGRYDQKIKNSLSGGSGGAPPPPPTSSPSPTSTQTTSTSSSTSTSSAAPTTTSGPGNCAGVPPWEAGTVYVSGNRVSHNGHVWAAKWWTMGDTPGGLVGVWTDDGVCGGKLDSHPPATTTHHTQIPSHSSIPTQTRPPPSQDDSEEQCAVDNRPHVRQEGDVGLESAGSARQDDTLRQKPVFRNSRFFRIPE